MVFLRSLLLPAPLVKEVNRRVEASVVEYLAPLVAKLPYLDLSGIFDMPGVDTVIDILSIISYFFPWQSVLGIVSILVSLQTIRLVVAFLKALWGILPIA